MSVEKIVLAYSGGLDTSVILKWLANEYGCPVIAYCADIGQKEDWDKVRAKGMATGADKVIVSDLREEFVRDYIFPAFRANAIYEGSYLLGTSLARPLIAREQVRIAAEENADAVSHGATGKGNDQVRFELSYLALNPRLTIIAPWRIWDLNSRQKLVAYAREHDIPVPVTKKNPYSSDENLLHISFEGGILEDPWNEPDEEMFKLTVSPERAPDTPTYIEIDFAQGTPVAIDGERLGPVALMTRLNDLGGANGIGRLDMVENRFVGMKSRGVYETPGGTILYKAHENLEMITLDKQTAHLKEQLAVTYAEIVYNGQWFTPLHEALDAFVESTQKNVTGKVKLKLYKGNIISAGTESPYSLYSENIATFGESDYDQKDSAGFINLFGLPIKVKALMEQGQLNK